MSDAPSLLRAAAADMEMLTEEIDRLAREIYRLEIQRDELIAHQREALRQMYRRGYFAGRASAKAGHPEVTNPERRMRGEMGSLFR